jgi:hypothetical protein
MCDIIQQGADMNQRIPESLSMLDWGLAPIMGNILPPRDPNEAMMTRTNTTTPHRTTSASRPPSENPTRAIDDKREPRLPARRPHHWRGERRRIGVLILEVGKWAKVMRWCGSPGGD